MITKLHINENLNNEKNKLLELRKFIEKNFEYVGKDFSKKVREVYYDKKNKKAIYGTASPEEENNWPRKVLIYCQFLGLIKIINF